MDGSGSTTLAVAQSNWPFGESVGGYGKLTFNFASPNMIRPSRPRVITRPHQLRRPEDPAAAAVVGLAGGYVPLAQIFSPFGDTADHVPLAYKLMLLGTIRHDPDPGLPDR